MQAISEFTARSGPVGQLGLFGGHVISAGAHLNTEADTDAAPDLHFHPQLDADAIPFAERYSHTGPADHHVYSSGDSDAYAGAYCHASPAADQHTGPGSSDEYASAGTADSAACHADAPVCLCS